MDRRCGRTEPDPCNKAPLMPSAVRTALALLLPVLGKTPKPAQSSCIDGSVRARAKQYCLSWDEANPGSCGLQDGQHGHAAAEELVSAAIGGNMLIVGGGGGGGGGLLSIWVRANEGGAGGCGRPPWLVVPTSCAGG